MEDMEVRVLILGETRAGVFTRAGAMATRHAAMTPGLRWEPVPVSFNLIAAIFPIQFLFWSCRASACPSFWPSISPLFSSSGRWLEDCEVELLKWLASGRLLRYHVICMGSVAHKLRTVLIEIQYGVLE
jgi:hypothetical protein